MSAALAPAAAQAPVRNPLPEICNPCRGSAPNAGALAPANCAGAEVPALPLGRAEQGAQRVDAPAP
eukprot:11214372-Alexandrium_andersonii.AAC.1